MASDHLSQQRAVAVSVLGLVFQLVFAVTFLLYGINGSDPAAISAAVAMFIATPIWGALALVFHQHRLERLEAMELESYRRSAAAQASVFEDVASSGENVQARKLAWMHRWFLPTLSLVIAVLYVGAGALLYFRQRPGTALDGYSAPPETGWAFGVGLVVAAVGFVFARYVAGMAKQRVWSLLSAGAGASVAASLLGLAVVAAHFVADVLGSTLLLRFLPLAVDVFMVVLGVEVVLNFVLWYYRPRRAGEYLRPPFDSRVLAFAAAPDRLAESISEAINYQFGFNVSSTWFYRLVSRSTTLLVVLAALLLYAMTMFTVVRADESALVLRGGKVTRVVEGGGLVWNLPWPFGSTVRFPAGAVNQFTVGAHDLTDQDEDSPILWTEQHADEENYIIVRAAAAGAGEETGIADLALVSIEAPVQYAVNDLRKYLLLAQDGPADDPDAVRRDVLSAVTRAAAIRYLSGFSVDELLGPRRAEIERGLRARLVSRYGELDAGIEVLFVGLQGVHPPQETAASFERVVAADATRAAAVSSAEAFAIRELASVAGDAATAREITASLDEIESLREAGAPEQRVAEQERRTMELISDAGGAAADLLSGARTERWEKALTAEARATRYAGQLEAWRAAPAAYEAYVYLRSLSSAVSGARVWVVPPGETSTVLDQIEESVSLGTPDPRDFEQDDTE